MHEGDTRLAARLRRELEGEVLFDRFTRGRYSTDASIYQIEPVGVVIPKSEGDIVRALAIAAEEGVSVVPRGAGTSQAGQAVGQGLVVDTSKHLTRVLQIDPADRLAVVEPGVVLEQLNAMLKPHGLWFPVDPATASQATIGGMAGNNSAGARSIRYGLMVDNVRAIDAVLADGTQHHFGAVPADLAAQGSPERYRALVRGVRAIYLREADELERRTPTVLRDVAGYNLDRVALDGHNMAHLLVGSEGTLAFFTRIHLDLAPLPLHTVLGVCHFPTLRAAMEATPAIAELEPCAVELVDRTLLEFAQDNPAFRDAVRRFVRGTPAALLLVEFAGDDRERGVRLLDRLEDLLRSRGGSAAALVRAVEPAFQQEIWAVRREALSLVMSVKGDTKPVSFIEDCAVPLEHLADYTDRLAEVFHRHGTSGTWYAHASVGCLHIRPALNLKDAGDVAKMRVIADEAHALVREFKGSHSGEHGDGIVRSEFLEPMLGARIVRAFEDVKACFDPRGLLNPGKIVRPPRMDDRSLFRYRPEYAATSRPAVALNWSAWQGWLGAVEMCNNNGACRRETAGVMCPSYRVTRDEEHTTRGRANTLRLALTGQLGPDALTSEELYRTLDLCVSCKACRRECPTGVDMARMKIEFLHHYRSRHGVPLGERVIAYLPRYAPWAARAPWLANARSTSGVLARLGERFLGLTARRPLPAWRSDVFAWGQDANSIQRTDRRERREVVLWVDTFNTYFEPENARAAVRVLEAAGYHVALAAPADGGRPVCCGRTFLSAGLVDEALAEMRRVVASLRPYAERGVPVVGLEPSCLLTLRDEFSALLPADEVEPLAPNAFLLEEFLANEAASGQLRLDLRPVAAKRLLVHGHCHQKAFGLMPAVERVLSRIPGVTVQTIESSCCGMAGSFGYEAAHYELSMRMAELSLLPAVRAAGPDSWIVADGTSCRRQILDGTGREALHVACVLEAALGRTMKHTAPE